MGIPALLYAMAPALRNQESMEWQPLGPLNQVEASSQPVPMTMTHRTVTGWKQVDKKETIFVQRLPDGTLLAQSSVCTHLGCIVHWEATTQHFACPCHGGVYDRMGNVIAGPPPRPLDRYEVKVENGLVEVGQRYRMGG
jgi:menaquinol-cytochrome c reductase iron-sulfur subunit